MKKWSDPPCKRNLCRYIQVHCDSLGTIQMKF